MTDELHRIGVCHSTDFAYPHGLFNDVDQQLLNQGGYQFPYGGNRWAAATFISPLADIPRIDTGSTRQAFIRALHIAFWRNQRSPG